MRETCSSGSVRGAFSNERPYRERRAEAHVRDPCFRFCEGFRMAAHRQTYQPALRAGVRKPAGKEPAGGGLAAVYGDLTAGPRAGVRWRESERVVDRRLAPAGGCRCGLRPSDFGVAVCVAPAISGQMPTVVRHGRRHPPTGGRSEELNTAITALRSRRRLGTMADRAVQRRARSSRG
jgi:hypothetical protein